MNYSYKLVMLGKLVKSLGTVVITFIVYVFGSLNTFADMYFGWNIVFFCEKLPNFVQYFNFWRIPLLAKI